MWKWLKIFIWGGLALILLAFAWGYLFGRPILEQFVAERLQLELARAGTSHIHIERPQIALTAIELPELSFTRSTYHITFQDLKIQWNRENIQGFLKEMFQGQTSNSHYSLTNIQKSGSFPHLPFHSISIGTGLVETVAVPETEQLNLTNTPIAEIHGLLAISEKDVTFTGDITLPQQLELKNCNVKLLPQFSLQLSANTSRLLSLPEPWNVQSELVTFSAEDLLTESIPIQSSISTVSVKNNSETVLSGKLNATGSIAPEILTATIEGELKETRSTLTARLSQPLKNDLNGTVSLSGTPFDLELVEGILKSLHFPLPQNLAIHGGTLIPKATISWGTPLTQKYSLEMQDGAFHYSELLNIERASLALSLTSTPSGFSIPTTPFLAEKVTYGSGTKALSASNLHGTVAGKISSSGGYSLQFSKLGIQLLDSNVESSGFRLKSNTQSLTIPIEARELPLENLFALYPDSPVAGSGKLIVKLPLTIGQDGVAIQNGTLRALPPGGVLQYTGETNSIVNEQLALTLKILEHYQYDSLEADVFLEPDGDLALKTRLSGKNPLLNNSRRANVNINIEENLFQLLKSLKAASKFTGN